MKYNTNEHNTELYTYCSSRSTLSSHTTEKCHTSGWSGVLLETSELVTNRGWRREDYDVWIQSQHQTQTSPQTGAKLKRRGL